MVCILFVLQLQRYKIFLDFCYILQSFLYSILHFITLLQRVGNFSNIISKSIIIDLVRQYGLREAFVYVLRYIKDSLTIGIYKELNEA